MTELAPGDPVVWWADRHGRGRAPDDPDAIRRTGVIDSVYRHPADPTHITAYLVTRYSTLTGSYLVTVRPDQHHPQRLNDDNG